MIVGGEKVGVNDRFPDRQSGDGFRLGRHANCYAKVWVVYRLRRRIRNGGGEGCVLELLTGGRIGCDEPRLECTEVPPKVLESAPMCGG